MDIIHYDPMLFNKTGAVARLDGKYIIHIGEASKDQYRILIYKPSSFFSENHLLSLDYTMLVNKTAALNKCFKICQQNSQVGADLFVKALGIDLLKELEERDNHEV